MTPQAWRRSHPVLVPDAGSMGGLGAVRSLGRAGYPVHACATERHALGLHSRYAAFGVLCPPYHDADFVPWLRDYTTAHNIQALVPSEGLVLAIRPKLDEFSSLLPTSAREDILLRGISKVDTHDALAGAAAETRLSDHLPPSLIVEAGRSLPGAVTLRSLGTPLYIKVDACHGGPDAPSAVYRVATAEAASDRLPEVLRGYRKVLVQGHVPGVGVGAFFLLWNGTVKAEFMHRRIHEVPHTGGVSSLRASWWHQGIRDDALTKLRRLGWEGVAMMEYRWDAASDTFSFIEMNGRFWGSLHLALFAGVDFPVLLMDSFFGRTVDAPAAFPLGLRCRNTFPKEIQYVWSRLRDPNLPHAARLWSIVEFVFLSLDSRVKSDLLFPGDTRLYWRRLQHFLRTLG